MIFGCPVPFVRQGGGGGGGGGFFGIFLRRFGRLGGGECSGGGGFGEFGVGGSMGVRGAVRDWNFVRTL